MKKFYIMKEKYKRPIPFYNDEIFEIERNTKFLRDLSNSH